MARQRQGALMILSILVIGGSACGGGVTTSGSPQATSVSPTTAPSLALSAPPNCTPNGTALQLAGMGARTFSYDTECLAAPAGTAFTIIFENQSPGVSHNVEILDHPGGTPLFTGKLIVGPKTITYKVTALDAGTYYYHCSVHPTEMNGDLIVGG
jgi:plastocyanin